MPTKAKERRIARLALAFALLLIACSAFFLIPAHPVKADDPGDNYPWPGATNVGLSEWGYSTCPSNDSNCMAATALYKGATYGVTDPWGYYLRNCTSWAAWAVHNRDGVDVPHGLGNAKDWATSASSDNITVNTTPANGAVAQWNGASWNYNYGHVAWVETVNSSTSITIEEYNGQVDGSGNPTGVWSTQTLTKGNSKPLPWPDNFIHFKDLSGTTTPTPTSGSDNTVLAVKKLTMSDGTNEVFWAKGTNTFESWWRSGTGITTSSLVSIPQGDIKAIDAQLMPDNLHLIYTATTNYIWQTAWYPGQTPSTGLLLHSPSNIRAIQKTIGPDGVTHQMYVLTDTGVSEYWWNSTSNGIQGGSLYTLANPVAMYKTLEPDGTQVVYIADANYAYMLRWGGSVGSLQVSTITNISNITAISFSKDSDGKHRLYVGSSSGSIWEISWYVPGSYSTWYMAGGAPVVALQKWESDSTQVLYEATSGGVFEYYWSQTSNASLTGDTVVGSLSSVHAFVRTTDPNGVQSVYTATGTNVLESWWIPGGNGPTTGQIA